MAGYDYAAGMSNNAVAAYDEGLVPASKVRGVPAALVREFCNAGEWHHSSRMYNRVDFYDPDVVRGTFGLPGSNSDYRNEDAVAALAAHKARKSDALFHDASRVTWTDFQQERRRYGRTTKNVWVPYEREFIGLVRLRGQMVDLLTDRGVLTKKGTGKTVVIQLGRACTIRTWNLRAKKVGVVA